MISRATPVIALLAIALVVIGVFVALQTPTSAEDTGKYLPPGFRPDVIASLNRVNSLISSDSFINELLSNSKMKEIMSKINLSPETVKEILTEKPGGSLYTMYTNASGEPAYIIQIAVGRLSTESAMEPLSRYYVNETNLAESYIIYVKVSPEGNTLTITDVSIRKNPLANVGFGFVPAPITQCRGCVSS